MWYRPSRWTVAAFAFAVVAGFIAWLILGKDGRTMRLADGREVSVIAVTYGTNHVLEQGPPWARLMARYGSRSMAYRFGFWSSDFYRSPTPSVMVWTRWRPGESNKPSNYASVADAHSFETEPVYAQASQTEPVNKDHTILAWRFDNYPRLQKEWTLHFYDYDLFRVRARRAGEATIRNPAPLVKPASTAPIAPVNATNGALECTLVNLRCGGPPPRRPLTAKSAIAPWVTAEFEFRENGQPATNWTVKRVEAFGATGNYFSGDRLVVELEEGRRVARFTGAFWQEEMDWKLVAHVAPTRNFPTDSLWTVRLPTSAFLTESFVTNLQAEARGLRNTRLSIGPEIGGMVEPNKPGLRRAKLRINYTPDTPDLYVDIASATDDQGHEILISRSLASRSGSCEADMKSLFNAQSVELSFAIHRSSKLEFRVRPVLVSTNTLLNKP